MGKDKPIVRDGLNYLINKKGIEILSLVIPKKDPKVEGLENIAKDNNIPIKDDNTIYRYIKEGQFNKKDIDLVISFLYPKKIKKSLIRFPKIGCINFHPAPLPEFKGFAPYTFGIYEQSSYWGVSAHFVDEDFDTGDIIKVKTFNINPKKETAFSLEQKTQKELLKLFKEIIDKVCEKGSLPRTPQKKVGKYYSKKDFENLRQIKPEDTIDEIERKCMAFWCPPWPGAKYKGFTLIDNKILKEIINGKYSKE